MRREVNLLDGPEERVGMARPLTRRGRRRRREEGCRPSLAAVALGSIGSINSLLQSLAWPLLRLSLLQKKQDDSSNGREKGRSKSLCSPVNRRWAYSPGSISTVMISPSHTRYMCCCCSPPSSIQSSLASLSSINEWECYQEVALACDWPLTRKWSQSGLTRPRRLLLSRPSLPPLSDQPYTHPHCQSWKN